MTNISKVAVSLADDLVARGAQLGRPVAGDEHPDPVYAAIDAHQKAYVAVRAAVAESDRFVSLPTSWKGVRGERLPGFGVVRLHIRYPLQQYLSRAREKKKLRQLYPSIGSTRYLRPARGVRRRYCRGCQRAGLPA